MQIELSIWVAITVVAFGVLHNSFKVGVIFGLTVLLVGNVVYLVVPEEYHPAR